MLSVSLRDLPSKTLGPRLPGDGSALTLPTPSAPRRHSSDVSQTRLLHFSGRLEGRWRSLLRVNKLRVVSRIEVHRTARRPTDGPAYSQPARFARPAGSCLSLRSLLL